MKHLLVAILFLSVSLFAELTNRPIDKALIESGVQIVDIRTPGEWVETGLVKGSIPIMFFDERGQYDVATFLDKLRKQVDTSKEFALICRTGSRTVPVSDFLSKKFDYKVINITGGIMNGMRNGIPLEPYRQK